MTDDRLRSGHQPLDEILDGGLPANGITIIMGLPGSGKTIIAQQYAFRNARPDRPAVYFSTLSEPLEKIIRFGQTLEFFDAAAIGVMTLDLDAAGSWRPTRRSSACATTRTARSPAARCTTTSIPPTPRARGSSGSSPRAPASAASWSTASGAGTGPGCGAGR